MEETQTLDDSQASYLPNVQRIVSVRHIIDVLSYCMITCSYPDRIGGDRLQ